jgi:hypothetical protein
VAEVTDPNGVQWSVYRARPKWESSGGGGGSSSISTGSILGDLLGFILQPIFELIFEFILYLLFTGPFLFIARLLGVPSTIVIERAGTPVSQERVRGWGKSQRRIEEIAESAAAGTLPASDLTWEGYR